MSNSKQNIAQIEQVLHYAFGMPMPGRSYTSENYRFGFNGMEKDDEWKGSGNSLDFGARIYDSRLGRWLAKDPLMGKYPWATPYCFVANKPIVFKDPDGRIIDWYGKNLTATQRKAIQKNVNDLRIRSKMFDYIYTRLHQSETIFTINYYNPAGSSKSAYYRPKDNSLNLENKSDDSAISEEFFHAFQSLIYGNWQDEQKRLQNEGIANYKKTGISPDWDKLKFNNVGTNIAFIESEAKLMKYLILNQAGNKQSFIIDRDNRSAGKLGQTYIGSESQRIIDGKLKIGKATMFSAQSTLFNWANQHLPATKSYTGSNGVFINSSPSALQDVIDNQEPILDSPIERDGNIPNNEQDQIPQG